MNRTPSLATLRLGTRASALARWQTASVRRRLESLDPDLTCAEVILRTQGDRDEQTPLPSIGGQGVFTDALERALLANEIDVAVHSLKDVPVDLTPGLVLAAVGMREDPRDALLSARGWTLATLPQGAVVGTCSLRRSAQLLAQRSDLQLAPLRGNVDTRIRQIAAGRFDAIILAAAGVRRLGLTSHVSEVLDALVMMPAPGQGALAMQCRADDERALALLAPLEDRATRGETDAERAFLKGLGGGCTAPIAALARADGESLRLRGLVVSVDGRRRIDVDGESALDDGAELGAGLALEALARGAGALLP